MRDKTTVREKPVPIILAAMVMRLFGVTDAEKLFMQRTF